MPITYEYNATSNIVYARPYGELSAQEFFAYLDDLMHDAEVKDGVLTIHGERRFEKESTEENVHRVERSYGSFTRSFSLPNNIDVEKVDAAMKDGVLSVRLPKRESAKPKAIEVK